ncbi:MAG: hypothetical protein WDN31_19010 [Hyphomicrobium sp.]
MRPYSTRASSGHRGRRADVAGRSLQTAAGGEIVPITDFEMALSWRGYAMIELWRRRIRPGFKSGYEALPASWRQRINGMLQAGPSEDEYADERSAT